jgi:transcriptional regulator with XRE-family HTH domain
LNKVAKMESLTADVLWLAIKVQHKLGDAVRKRVGRRNCAATMPARPNMLLINVGRLMSETGVPMNSEWAEPPQEQGNTGKATPGALLAAQREAMGWTVEQIADQLKLATRQVKALEAGDYAALPNMAVVRGFVRAYAKVVKIDAAPLVAMIEVQRADQPRGVAPRKDLAQSFSESRFPSMTRSSAPAGWLIGGGGGGVGALARTRTRAA